MEIQGKLGLKNEDGLSRIGYISPILHTKMAENVQNWNKRWTVLVM